MKKTISHTYFPNGHRINWWREVPFETAFGVDKHGNRWFVFARLFKDERDRKA